MLKVNTAHNTGFSLSPMLLFFFDGRRRVVSFLCPLIWLQIIWFHSWKPLDRPCNSIRESTPSICRFGSSFSAHSTVLVKGGQFRCGWHTARHADKTFGQFERDRLSAFLGLKTNSRQLAQSRSGHFIPRFDSRLHALEYQTSMVVETSRDLKQIGSSEALNRKRRRRRKPRLTGLSKQRQTANARERSRMRSISAAMLQLRCHLPSSVAPKEKKLSKIQTLRFAIRYIGDLWEVLQRGQESETETSSSKSECKADKSGLVDETIERERPRAKRCFKFERDKAPCMYLEQAVSQACAWCSILIIETILIGFKTHLCYWRNRWYNGVLIGLICNCLSFKSSPLRI